MIVFEIPTFFPEYYYISYFQIAVGIILTVIGIAIKIAQIKGKWLNLKSFSGIAIAGFGLVLVFALGLTNLGMYKEHEHLYSLYKSGDYEVVKGVVKVLHEQPEQGHAAGDLIALSEREFEFSFFTNKDYSYSATISNGGYLKDGVHAEIFHVNNDILKVEIFK